MVQPNLPKTLEEALVLQANFVGISQITKNNFKQFYKRGKVLQALGAVFLLDEKRQIGRTATLQEVEKNIGKTFNITNQYDDKKLEAVKKKMLKDITNTLIKNEKSWVEEVGSKEPTINEENMEAGKKLEEITNPSESEEAKYPY